MSTDAVFYHEILARCSAHSVYAAALRWLREDVDIPDSKLHITVADFEVCYLLFSILFISHITSAKDVM